MKINDILWNGLLSMIPLYCANRKLMELSCSGYTICICAGLETNFIRVGDYCIYCHYSGIIMSSMASQITGASVVYWIVCSGADQRKHQRSTSLAFARGIHRWPVNSPHKGPVTQKMLPSVDLIMGQNDCLRRLFGKCDYMDVITSGQSPSLKIVQMAITCYYTFQTSLIRTLQIRYIRIKASHMTDTSIVQQILYAVDKINIKATH